MSDVYETVMSKSNTYCGYSIPIISYPYDKHLQLNKDLVEIIDELDEFYKTTKADTSKNRDGGTKTKSILTHNFSKFNIFDRTEYESVRKFKQFVGDSYKHYIETYTKLDFFSIFPNIHIQCWGNKIGKFDYLNRHAHVGWFSDELELSSNYFVKSPGHETHTRYYSPMTLNKDEYTYTKNVEGHLTIFPSFVEHDTTANRSANNSRYTLGMDVANPTPEQVEEANSHSCVVKLYEHTK